ncbi:thiol-disulfide oxidoreductase LTO1 isoform X2 [Populus nigra]|uniref:thiol-disulfide oxidoreductase LTO1 isoform X2 n=1 Tax=Populus nigra TaxID=3691 RepID=UPI002B2781C3|nr:thiol-disulfide oxidoreductase LTO1 isoform X2 [Populus nigra]
MASFLNITSPPFFSSRTSLSLSPPPTLTSQLTQFKKGWCWKLKCMPSSGPSQESDSEQHETAPSPSNSASLLSSSSVSTYNWCAGLGGVGFLETAYLTFLKLTNSDAFCPIGGGNCGDVLSSDYAVVFGVPLPLIGMISYGLVAALGLQWSGKKFPIGIEESNGRLLLLGCTTSMAVASGYFLYILSTKFSGTSCTYCLLSAFLSFSLFFITLKDFDLEEIQKFLGLQLCIASVVIFSLNTSYATLQPASSSLADINLEYFTTEITTPSSPFAISLARHLQSTGAKMYGAFWCSHCQEQKQMFGKEAAELLNYVECFPNGFRKGTKMIKACADAKLEGFPTWVINGQVLSGDQELSELAKVSGFKIEESNQPS